MNLLLFLWGARSMWTKMNTLKLGYQGRGEFKSRMALGIHSCHAGVSFDLLISFGQISIQAYYSNQISPPSVPLLWSLPTHHHNVVSTTKAMERWWVCRLQCRWCLNRVQRILRIVWSGQGSSNGMLRDAIAKDPNFSAGCSSCRVWVVMRTHRSRWQYEYKLIYT